MRLFNKITKREVSVNDYIFKQLNLSGEIRNFDIILPKQIEDNTQIEDENNTLNDEIGDENTNLIDTVVNDIKIEDNTQIEDIKTNKKKRGLYKKKII